MACHCLIRKINFLWIVWKKNQNHSIARYKWEWCYIVWGINKIQLAMYFHKYNCSSPCPWSHKMPSILHCHWFCLCDFHFFFPQGKELAMLVSIDLLAGGPQSQHSREVCFFICSSTGCWASPPLSPYRRFWETENFYHILNKSAWLYTETPRERPCSVTEFVTKRILHNEEVKASNQILFFFFFLS